MIEGKKKKRDDYVIVIDKRERRIYGLHRCAGRVVKARLIECTLRSGDDNGQTPPRLLSSMKIRTILRARYILELTLEGSSSFCFNPILVVHLKS